MTRAALVFLLLLITAAARGSAQGSTSETLSEAKALYENLDVERALVLLRQVVSPSSPFEVTPAQRVEAYKYLGASLAFIGMRDSAVVYFRAALERDPFTDLDPQSFTPAQLAAFAKAKQLTFSVGARAVAPTRLHPRTEPLTFTVFSTHSGSLRTNLTSDRDSTTVVLFDGESDGLQEIRWSGLVGGGRLAPPGRYRLTVRGRGQTTNAIDSADVYFDVAHEHPPLEDTLPDLAAAALLPEQEPGAVGRQELLAGMSVAASALIMATVMSDSALQRRGPVFAAAVGGTGALTGIIAFLWHRNHRTIAANIAENRRRRDERATANAAVRQRNDEKLAQTVLVISPALTPGRE